MDNTIRILIIDDDRTQQTRLEQVLSRELGCSISVAASSEDGRRIFLSYKPEVVILDLGLTEGDPSTGLNLLSELSALDPTARAIVLTGHDGDEFGSNAIRRGAASFLQKPVNSVVLTTLVRDFAQTSRFRRLGLDTSDQSTPPGFIGNSAPMQNVYKMIRHCAQSNANVLVVGETGTGKELVAQAIHALSTRSIGPLSIYFGSAPQSMAESELFGYAPGAFTGALKSGSRGAIQQSHGGTLFIDELCSLDQDLQRKLLRVVEDKMFKPLGSERFEYSDFRLVCAAQPRIYDFVRTERFREDLFARLEGLTITLPPLRERREDIIPLARAFLNRHRSEQHLVGAGPSVIEFSPATQEALLRFSWPRNVRQLSHIVRHGIVQANCRGSEIIDFIDIRDRLQGDIGEISDTTLSTPVVPMEQQMNLRNAITQLERTMITAALSRNSFALSATSRELGMGRTTLWRRIKELGIIAEQN